MTSHSTTATNQQPKTMPIILLTAGHGGKDMGAVNANYQGKTHTESSIACEMRNITAHILKNDYGLIVKTDGIAMDNLPLKNTLPLYINNLKSIKPKRFKSAPLPFTGQKRMFLRHFEKILKDNIPNDGKGWTVLDVFGGSGLLAHNAKHILPKSTVIYNDFDNYTDRLAHINDTNLLRQALFELLKDEPRSTKLSDTAKAQVIAHIKDFASNGGFVDVQTIAGWLLFSGWQVGGLDEFLAESTFYNRIVKRDYQPSDGYLNGLTITKDSFEVLLTKYQNTPNCLLILDPPYVCTMQKAYALHKTGQYFGMTKFLQLMYFVRPPYVFFSSTRSELLTYMDYLKAYELDKWQIVGNFTHIKVNSSINKNACYEDNILAKF